MVKKAHILFILLALAATAGAQNDTVNGYVCSHGVDTSMWITLDNPTTIMNSSSPIYFGFDFLYFGQAMRWVRLTPFGTVTFEDEPPTSYSYYTWPHTLFPFESIMYGGGSYWKYQTFGTPGDRILVFEYIDGAYGGTNINCTYQIQLREADNSIHFVYGPPPALQSYSSGISLTGLEEAITMVNLHATGDFWLYANNQPWPGEGHYYSFVPQPCLPRANASIQLNSPTSVTLFLQPANPQAAACHIEYGPAGFARGTGTLISTTLSQIDIDTLNSGEDYDFYITPLCADSSEGITKMIRHRAACSLSDADSNLINYWDLRQNNVTCRHGNLYRSSLHTGVIDYGYSSHTSRHTIHSDTAETDPRTLGGLHTVPKGHCYSVRLGNWMIGGERESITYRLHVDTNSYDLLLLHYAIVEQDPSHDSASQPFFTFGIYDTNGSLVSSCYYANFVAGDLSGWNSIDYRGEPLVWHDWQTVGVDLSPLHGMDIDVILDNADCAGGAHFGYSYFTLESGTKHIKADRCGAADVNILRVPKGFAYRWYREGDNTTLSTADSLVVTDGDRYFCEATYLLQNTSCSIILSSYGGSRYPVADFDFEPQNACGNVCQLVNRSFVTRDSLHTQTTSTPCDSYLWRFDDGTTSSLISPTRRFTPGTHAVTLYAMLANGQCADSVTKTINAVDIIDTSISVQICSPDTLFLGDSAYTASGSYTHTEVQLGCTTVTHLNLTVLPSYNISHADTFQLGQTYLWHGTAYQRPGLYTTPLRTLLGCDSIYTLRLSSIERHDTLVCQDALPFSWHGRTMTAEGADTLVFPTKHAGADSIVVLAVSTRKHPDHITAPALHCDSIPYYSIPLSDTLCYTFLTDPCDPQIDTLSRIIPSTTTLLIIQSAHMDEPSCPTSDTLMLDPLRPVVARLEVQPKWIAEGESDITATDRSNVSGWREWYVNNVLQESQEPTLVYHSDLQGDSVTVMLVIGINECTDTAYTTVSIRHQNLIWFPNVFTPSRADNNIFRGYGTNISNYDLHIFRRRGGRVFHTQEIEEGWDGTFQGVPLPQGSYAYICTYTTPTGEMQKAYGTVTLIR